MGDSEDDEEEDTLFEYEDNTFFKCELEESDLAVDNGDNETRRDEKIEEKELDADIK
jgi:hypothetical protein